MAKFSTHYSAISFLVKDSQALNKVLKCALIFGLGHVLEHRQESLEVYQFGVHF